MKVGLSGNLGKSFPTDYTLFGIKPEIDLFASRLNYQKKTFCFL